jgi:inner membrane protein
VLVGESIDRRAPGGQSLAPATRRTAIVTLMALGSNLPDFDLLYSSVSGNKLDYLLEHRGYTHTLVGALIIGALSYLACALVLRRRGVVASAAERRLLAGVALGAPLLHVAMDYTNSYGVHPFWPFDDRWIYGDAVLIVEPLLWAACAPLVFLLRTFIARLLVALVLLAGIALSVGSGLVRPPNAAFLCALTLAMLWLGMRARPQRALAAGIAVWLVTTGIFMLASHIAGRRVEALAARDFSGAGTLDHALTPMPEDPLCWELILMQLEPGRFVLRRAALSLAPEWIPAAHCRQRQIGEPTLAPLVPVAARPTPAIEWHGEIALAPRALAELAARDCAAAALLRFARAPWAAARGASWWLGDLRFGGRRGQPGMAEVQVPGSEACPRHVPPWRPPREDVLHAADTPSTDPGVARP